MATEVAKTTIIGTSNEEPTSQKECGSEKSNLSSWQELYKSNGRSDSQEDRRRELLELQKKKRQANFAAHRDLGLLDEFEEEENEKNVETMECMTSSNKIKFRKYAKTLMHSEWMIDVPRDLEDKWFFVPCPAGKRCLVVAQKGNTRAYSASGKVLATFPSLLPGGSYDKNTIIASRYAVLDCVWSYHSSTYYVLDVLAWGNQPFLDCETEFRFFWLQSQLPEIPLAEISNRNKFRFLSLPFRRCSATVMEEIMTGPPPFPEVMDGVLFYHREAHYTAGQCPLVVWLLPFMLSEVFGIHISDALSAQQPETYPGHLMFVEHFQSQPRHVRKQEYKQRKAASRSVLNDTSMESQNSDELQE